MKIFDSILIYAYGGPETMDDVLPFLESVARGKNIPKERLNSVLKHYALFDGRSPMNGAIREFMRLWQEHETSLPIYFGCRYANPPLKETLKQMISDGRRHTRVLIPAPFGGYLETYHEKLAEVCDELKSELGENTELPSVTEVRTSSEIQYSLQPLPELEVAKPFSENRLFIDASYQTISETISDWQSASILFSVHSLPKALAARSGYEREVLTFFETMKLRFPNHECHLAWQSASASPIPWLGPSVLDKIQNIANKFKDSNAEKKLILVPAGFPFENMEVVYDLDVEARQFAERLGFQVRRAPTVGLRPEFLKMVFDFC